MSNGRMREKTVGEENSYYTSSDFGLRQEVKRIGD